MKFRIEQLAVICKDTARAKRFLEKIGVGEWVEDHVIANGKVFGTEGRNEADLSFAYDIFAGKEFEVLNYTKGDNWMDTSIRGRDSVSHLGMHVTSEELAAWRAFMAAEGVLVAQEVLTESHTNPVIAGKRSYEYVIFDTKEIIGVDLKFIRRIDKA
jgi:hypothetical protein